MVTKVETEEVCNECGSTNIGYDAWVKKIGGELEVVAGPYDRCICLTDSCLRYENETVGRLVLVQNLKDCDGQDCYYNGDKGVMKEVKSTVQQVTLNQVKKGESFKRTIDYGPNKGEAFGATVYFNDRLYAKNPGTGFELYACTHTDGKWEVYLYGEELVWVGKESYWYCSICEESN